MSTDTTTPTRRHAGPPLWMLATVSSVLFVGGIAVSAALAGGLANPLGPDATVIDYLHRSGLPAALRWAAFLQFGASITLGLYGATVYSRLNFLGIRAAGATIALFGGVGASVLLGLSGLSSWVLSRPEVLANLPVARAVQDLAFVTGGPGHTTLLGLLLAGIAIPAWFARLLPRWLAVVGVVLALICELSSVTLLTYAGTFALPVGRFGGLAWLIAAGALLPRARANRNVTAG
jgi:hypothetical protein